MSELEKEYNELREMIEKGKRRLTVLRKKIKQERKGGKSGL